MLIKIALYEFLRIIRSKTYLFGLIIVPVIAVIPIIAILIGEYRDKNNKDDFDFFKDISIAVLDKADILPSKESIHVYKIPYGETLPDENEKTKFRNIKVKRLSSFDEGKEILKSEEYMHFFVIPEQYNSDKNKKIEVIVTNKESAGLNVVTYSKLDPFFAYIQLKNMGLSRKDVIRLVRHPYYEVFPLEKDDGKLSETTLSIQVVVPIVLILAFFMAITTSYDNIVLSVTRERRNKLIEVLLASVSAQSLIFGKVLGVLGSSLVKMIIWAFIFIVLPLAASFFSTDMISYQLSFSTVFFTSLFAALGILLYGSLCGGTAFLIDSDQGAKFPMLILVGIGSIPILCIHFFLLDQTALNKLVVFIFSVVPFFSPVGMPARIALQPNVPIFDIVLSLVLLLVSIYYSVRLSAKLLRVALARQGEKTGVVSLIKAILR